MSASLRIDADLCNDANLPLAKGDKAFTVFAQPVGESRVRVALTMAAAAISNA